MFHYVNDYSFKYYHFDVLELDKVIDDMIKNGKKIISFTEFKKMIKNNDKNINNSVLLTFDDGTKDHYEKVYPILKKNNVSALFFLCSNIVNKSILDINLIHNLISKVPFEELYQKFQELLLINEMKINKDNQVIKTDYDDEKMLYFKQMLQFILPDYERNKILSELCNIYDISLNYNDYYMTIDQIKEMKKNGMEFGFHTVNHKRLAKLSFEEQSYEILTNYNDLRKENLIEEDAPFSYPFGSYNNDTLKILKDYNIKYAFNIKNSSFNLNSNLLEIPRYDCNCLKVGEQYEK